MTLGLPIPFDEERDRAESFARSALRAAGAFRARAVAQRHQARFEEPEAGLQRLLGLLGHRAWWLPAWLDRIIPNVDLEGTGLERHEHPRPTGEPALGGEVG
jgi:hypothetical protein